MTEYIDLMFEILKTKKTCFRCLKMRYKIHKYIKKLRKEYIKQEQTKEKAQELIKEDKKKKARNR